MHAIHAPRVSTGAFTFIFVNINPTFAKTFFQGSDVFFTKRLQSINNFFASFVKVASKAIACVGKGNINIVGVQFFKTKHIFFQLHVFVQGCKVVVNSLNQTIVEGSGNIVCCKRSGQGIRIFVGSSVEVSTTAATSQSACQGVTVFMVSTHQTLEGVFTQFSIRTGHIQKVVAFADSCFVAFSVSNFRELHISAYQRAERSCSGAGSKAAVSQQFFHLRRQDVVSKTHQVFNIVFVISKSRFSCQHLC